MLIPLESWSFNADSHFGVVVSGVKHDNDDLSDAGPSYELGFISMVAYNNNDDNDNVDPAFDVIRYFNDVNEHVEVVNAIRTVPGLEPVDIAKAISEHFKKEE